MAVLVIPSVSFGALTVSCRPQDLYDMVTGQRCPTPSLAIQSVDEPSDEPVTIESLQARIADLEKQLQELQVVKKWYDEKVEADRQDAIEAEKAAEIRQKRIDECLKKYSDGKKMVPFCYPTSA